jgi:rod shape-determining protein MreD
MVQDPGERSTLQPFLAVALGGVASLAGFVAVGVVVADPRVSVAPALRTLVSSVPYDVALTPFVVPLVAGASRRLARDSLRRL